MMLSSVIAVITPVLIVMRVYYHTVIARNAVNVVKNCQIKIAQLGRRKCILEDRFFALP